MSNNSVTTATAAAGGKTIAHSNSDSNNSSLSSYQSIMGADQDIPLPWSSSMTELVTKAQILRQSIIKATAMQESNSCTNNS